MSVRPDRRALPPSGHRRRVVRTHQATAPGRFTPGPGPAASPGSPPTAASATGTGPVAGLLAGLALVLAVLPARAQHPAGSCDGTGEHPFPAPLASPLEPRTRLAPVRVDRGDRERWVALADLGERIPFWIARPCPGRGTGGGGSAGADRDGPALAGSFAGAAFSRFDAEGNGNEFVEAHFRVGFRLRARLEGVAARLELYHVSSHLGDEFLERTGRSPISTSREGLELLVAERWPGGFRVYGGPGVLVRSTEELDPASVRGGVEWRGADVRWGPFAPYASAEAFSWAELDWDPMLAGEAGVAFGGGRFRLGLMAGTGPSRAEQFFREADETLWGAFFSVTR